MTLVNFMWLGNAYIGVHITQPGNWIEGYKVFDILKKHDKKCF